MKREMIVIDNKNNVVKCNILIKWNMNNSNYMAYTEDTSSNDELELYISKYIVDKDTIKLSDIEDDEEWKKAEEYVNKKLFDGDDEF